MSNDAVWAGRLQAAVRLDHLCFIQTGQWFTLTRAFGLGGIFCKCPTHDFYTENGHGRADNRFANKYVRLRGDEPEVVFVAQPLGLANGERALVDAA